MAETPADRDAGTRADRLVAVGEGEVTVAGVRSPYLHAGPADADEAVVLVHGNPGPAEDWRRLLARTGAFVRAVAPDMPGFGGADRPDSFVYTVDGYARHLAGVLDQLGIRRAHLVLHDFGGPWGLWWAADHPDRFASATLVNIGVLRGYRWHVLARIWRTSGLGEAFLRTGTRAATRQVLSRGTPRGLPREALDRMYDSLKDRSTQRAVLRLYRATDMAAVSEDLHRRLQGSDRPVLAVWGRHDPYLPVAYAERQRETFPRAEVVVLDESGHWPMLDDPASLEAAVLPFLERVTTRSTAAATGPG
jgi:pimeloyl-ACP methyl ester carboxylesterase